VLGGLGGRWVGVVNRGLVGGEILGGWVSLESGLLLFLFVVVVCCLLLLFVELLLLWWSRWLGI